MENYVVLRTCRVGRCIFIKDRIIELSRSASIKHLKSKNIIGDLPEVKTEYPGSGEIECASIELPVKQPKRRRGRPSRRKTGK